MIACFRNEDEEKKKDRLNYCYICGLNRRDMDRTGRKLDFNFHIQYKHKLWNYLYYIAYVKDKDETELTGIESYVMKCLDNRDIHWFPLCEEEYAIQILKLQLFFSSFNFSFFSLLENFEGKDKNLKKNVSDEIVEK